MNADERRSLKAAAMGAADSRSRPKQWDAFNACSNPVAVLSLLADLEAAERRVTALEHAAEEAGTVNETALILLREDANRHAASATTALARCQRGLKAAEARARNDAVCRMLVMLRLSSSLEVQRYADWIESELKPDWAAAPGSPEETTRPQDDPFCPWCGRENCTALHGGKPPGGP